MAGISWAPTGAAGAHALPQRLYMLRRCGSAWLAAAPAAGAHKPTLLSCGAARPSPADEDGAPKRRRGGGSAAQPAPAVQPVGDASDSGGDDGPPAPDNRSSSGKPRGEGATPCIHVTAPDGRCAAGIQRRGGAAHASSQGLGVCMHPARAVGRPLLRCAVLRRPPAAGLAPWRPASEAGSPQTVPLAPPPAAAARGAGGGAGAAAEDASDGGDEPPPLLIAGGDGEQGPAAAVESLGGRWWLPGCCALCPIY